MLEIHFTPGLGLKISTCRLVASNSAHSSADWIHCKIDYDKEGNDSHFFGNGGPMNLGEILDTFKLWVEK